MLSQKPSKEFIRIINENNRLIEEGERAEKTLKFDKLVDCSYNVAMAGLTGKRWYFFLWDEDNIEHLFNHSISPNEAEQVFFNKYVITPNKKKHGPKRYRIDGKTDSGRSLRIIFQDFSQNTARVITGWDL